MPDSLDIRWDADQQRWSGGPLATPVGGGGPEQPNIPAATLAALLVLVVAVAIGVHAASPSSRAGVPEAGAEPHSDDECASGSNAARCDEDEPSGSGWSWDREDADEQEPAEEDRVPDGYELRRDSNGFELHVPEGWHRKDEGPPQGVFYRRDSKRHLIQIMELGGDHSSPQQAMDSLRSGLRDNPGYSDSGPTTLGGNSRGLELHYTYDHGEFGPREAYMRTFVGGDGEVYAVLAAAPSGDRALTRERYETAADSFCVTGHDCP